jgi:hypothetical protein
MWKLGLFLFSLILALIASELSWWIFIPAILFVIFCGELAVDAFKNVKDDEI